MTLRFKKNFENRQENIKLTLENNQLERKQARMSFILTREG